MWCRRECRHCEAGDLSLFPPVRPSGRLRRPVERVVVVCAGPNPSFDYYLKPRLDQGRHPFEIWQVEEGARFGGVAGRIHGTLILFCRYLSADWLDVVERHADALAGTALFLDDDMDALFADWTVPLWYRARLYHRHLRFRSRLQRCLDLLLVSNPRIARHGSPIHGVLHPRATAEDEPLVQPQSAPFRVAFHATSVHRREHWWLRSVLGDAIAAAPSIELEVVAGWPLRALWTGLPRLRVLPPQPWPTFRHDTRLRGADLLLAPLLPSVANAARAPTKRIDAHRLGAALLVGDEAVYRPTDAERALGMVAASTPQAWSKAIMGLVEDRGRLARLRALNDAVVQSWAAADEPSFDRLFADARRSG